MFLQIRDVARVLNVPESQVYRWIRADELPARQINDLYGVNAAELLEWASVRQLAVLPALFSSATADAPSSWLLPDALLRGGCAHGLVAHDRRGAIAGTLEGLPLPVGFDRDGYLQLILAREEQGATTVGRGVAIPHPRFPTVLPGAAACARLCVLATPLDLKAPDGVPVDVVWLLMSPSQHEHLRLLAELGVLLRQDDFLARVRQSGDVSALSQEIQRRLQESVGQGTSISSAASGGKT
jgi:nitrogen PTS system EIIA component